MINRLNCLLLGICVLVLSTASLAQTSRVTRYTVTTFNGTYSSISGSSFGSGDDNVYLCPQTLPFAFNYDSTDYSAGQSIYVNTNGGVSFGNALTGCCSNYLGNSSYQKFIQAYSYDGYIYGGLYYQVTGSAPNRVFTIEWYNYSPCCSNTKNMNMQVKLYEGTNVIEMLYSKHSNDMTGGSAGVGLNGSTTGVGGFVYQTYQVSGSSPSTDLRWTPAQNVAPTQLSLRPKLLDFSGVSAGSSATKYDTAFNLGPGYLKFTSYGISGSSAYTLGTPKNRAGATINLGDTITSGDYVVFPITFSPTTSGNLSGAFIAVTSGKDSGTQQSVFSGIGLAANVQYTFQPYNGVQYPDFSLFHHVAAHFGDTVYQTFYVTSNGTGPLGFNSISLAGLQSNMYAITHVPVNPLPVGQRDSIVVRFTPFYEGRPDATLNVSSNAINLPNVSVTLWGTGVLPHLVITPQSGTIATGTTPGTLTFDSVAIGDSVVRTLALHNTGTDTLVLTKQLVTYGDYDFTYYPLMGSDLRLAPDATKLVNVSFVPLQAGLRLASIRFYTNIPSTYPDKRDTSQVLVRISGTGVPFGKLAVSGPANVSTLVGVQKCIEDTIRNTGSADLTINSIRLGGANVSDYTITSPTLPMIIAKGGFEVVQICFNPANRGLSTASLDIVGSTSGRTQNMTLAINGTGQVGCASAGPNPVPFGVTYPGITLVGGNDSAVVTVTNCGDVPMTFSAAASPANYTVTSAPSASVAPNGTTTFTVYFAPTAMGSANGTLTITPSESSVTPVVVPLSGVGGAVTIAASGSPTNTEVGQTSTFTVTLVNNGNVAWTPNGATVTGDYTAGAVSPSPIPAGGQGTMTITFAPTQVGPRAGSLTFNNPDIVPVGGLPYNFTANGTQSARVSELTAKDGYSIGTSYPNPASREASVVVTMPHDAKVIVTLVRLDGSQVATVFNGALSQGQHTLNFDVTSVASGTYFYMLESGTTRLVRQMVVAK